MRHGKHSVPESQHVEWKEVWHDEYLKWICGFANAQGGMLVIGKNNKGLAVGVKNAHKLLEDLPNKIRATMGIVADVNLRMKDRMETIEITVPTYPNAISYHGKYYFRSGSTNQELSGYALDELLLEKYGRTYDSMPMPRIKASDFWHDAFDVFREKAVASKRLTREDVAISDEELLHSLRLTENSHLLLAAVLAFHQTPEQWRFGASVKIGYFENDSEIRYQDEITGAVVGIADRVVDLIFTKYFIGLIRYEGLQRIDDYPMPREALREAVMNAIVHRDYSTGSPVQIRVYDDRVYIANDCRLPIDITVEKLSAARKSVPHNPLLAGVMFRSGQIEAWGRGIERMSNACKTDNLLPPDFVITPQSFTVCFHIRDNRQEHRSDEHTNDISTSKSVHRMDSKNTVINEELFLTSIKNNPSVTASELSVLYGVTQRTIEKNIAKFKALGRIYRIGSARGKGGQWIVVEKQKEVRQTDSKRAVIGSVKSSVIGSVKSSVKILAMIKNKPDITASELSALFGVTQRTIEKNIAQLKVQGRIYRAGSARDGKWVVVE